MEKTDKWYEGIAVGIAVFILKVRNVTHKPRHTSLKLRMAGQSAPMDGQTWQ